MKKFTKVLAVILATVMVLPLACFASPEGIIPNDPVSVPLAVPTVDGYIDSGSEGWSDPAYMNYDTCGFFWAHNPLTTEAELYFAYDETGLYYAADITEGLPGVTMDGRDVTGVDQFIYSTGIDERIDLDDNGQPIYGFDGDVFGLMLDPMALLLEDAGMTGGTDYTALYLVGVFQGENGEEDYARMYRTRTTSKNGEITDLVQVAGHGTEDGWMFEAYIPWEIIVEDTIETSFWAVDFTVDDLLVHDTLIRAGVLYQDRFYNEEAEETSTWGRYIVVAKELIDGLGGHRGTGDDIKSMGLELRLQAQPYENPFEDVDENAWYAGAVEYCVRKGYVKGVTPTTFCPDDNLTRAQFVTMLANVAKADLTQYADVDSGFSDVNKGQWFHDAITWAAANGYANGVGGGLFSPDANVTRAQLARFFYVYTQLNGYDVSATTELTDFTDGDNVPGWAVTELKWAVAVGLINGISGAIVGDGFATRAQAASIIMRYTQTKFDKVEDPEPPVPTTYTITFDANGGTLEGDAEYTITEGATYADVLAALPVATLEGYNFTGWYNGEYKLNLEDTFAYTEDVTFTAAWEQVTEPEPPAKAFTITFDPAGGTMPEGVELSYGINYNDNYKEVTGVEYPVPTLDGYTFAGWFWEAYNYTLDPGTWDTGYFAVECDVDLVALWEEAPVVEPTKDWTITFDPGEGTMDEGFETSYGINNGDLYVDIIPNGYPTASLEGYTFAGWFLESYNFTLTQGDYESGNYALNESCTLVALWEEVVEPEPEKDWTITFDPAGGTMPEGVELSYGINTNDNYKEATGIEYPVPTLDGYVFAGWYWDVYNFNLDPGTWDTGYFAVACDVALVALWEEAPAPAKDWTITFDPGEGTMDEGFETSYGINMGDFYADIIPNGYPTASLEGYVFAGWFLESYNFTLTQGDYESGYYALNESCTLVALWEEEVVEEPKDWVITFDPDGGELLGPETYGINKGDYYTDIFDGVLPQATLEGYVLIGWYCEKWNFTLTQGDLDGGGYYAVDEDNLFVALWEEAPIVEPTKDWTITFDPDGGVMPEGVELSYGINYNENYKEATGIEYPVPTLDGYVFAGWYWDVYNFNLDPGTWDTGYFAVECDVALVALWEEAPVVEPTKDWTITFDPDGGEMVGPTEYGINMGDFYTDIFDGVLPQATLEGYLLVGWYCEKYNFTLTQGDLDNGGYYAVAEDNVLVALWEEAPVVELPDYATLYETLVAAIEEKGGFYTQFHEYEYINSSNGVVVYATSFQGGEFIDLWYLGDVEVTITLYPDRVLDFETTPEQDVDIDAMLMELCGYTLADFWTASVA